MFQPLKCFASIDSPQRRRLNAKQTRAQFGPLETLQEIAIYIDRFHNLDLFQQGWYQIKVSMRWEDNGHGSPGTPARVIQYEAPDLGPDSMVGMWKIDDVDHSFTTQPFMIKYARQDVLLSVMVSFNLTLGIAEIPSTAAVLLKFELLYAPVLENKMNLQASFASSPASVHEFRVPSKALLGLHSYCPLHFDSFHAALVDLSLHIVLLKAGAYSMRQKDGSSTFGLDNDVIKVHEDNEIPGNEPRGGSRAWSMIRALCSAREILLEELQKISKVINQPFEDLNYTVPGESFNSKLGSKMVGSDMHAIEATINQLESNSKDGLMKVDGISGLATDGKIWSISSDELLYMFNSLGNQLHFLWNVFLKYHRAHRKMILEYLRNLWTSERKTEWSIWMVYMKIEVPTRYLRSMDESSHGSRLGKVSVPRKLGGSNDDPAQFSTARAELHRRSIGQMKINNQSVQDMHIFGEPMDIPVILVEQYVVSALPVATSNDAASQPPSQNGTAFVVQGLKSLPQLLGVAAEKSSRILKIVVFVHGFQGHHLDLRLVRNQWLLIDPEAECLMSEANEGRTSGDFQEMGARLANEVVSFVKRKIERALRFGGCKLIKLSFVGHSIGNVIIRSALTERAMEPYLKYLHTYMSVSGPHLGYLYSSNILFNSGLWLLKKVKGSQCIHQLTFTDEQEMQNTYLYKLCKQKTLQHFKNLILLSSPQDGYVPYHSARVELCQAATFDYSTKGEIFLEMLNDLIDQIRYPSSEQRTFLRCDVNFNTSSQGRNFNTLSGRAAHIEFLETDIFARFVMWSYRELFL